MVTAVALGTDQRLLLAGLGALFLAVLVFITALSGIGRTTAGPEWARRIDRYRAHRGGHVAERTRPLRGALSAGERAVRSAGVEERIARDLDRAGMSIRPHEWVMLRIGIAVAAVAAVTVVGRASPLGMLPAAVAGWLATRVYLRSKITRRLTAFNDQLPDALQLVASSLRSGFTVSQALERLARQDIRPLGGEMARAVAETRIGVSIEDALDKAAARMDCPDLSWVVMAIRIQREVGGNLADVIDTTVDTMRERTRLRRHIRALSAEGRLTAYILIALPLVIGGFMLIIRPDYMRPMFTQPIGILLLLLGSASLVAGWIWMSRIIKVEA